MPTKKQSLGKLGEQLVCKTCSCPKCKRKKTLRQLPVNFKCADIICDFCGFLGQVKTSTVSDVSVLPRIVLGAAWGPQKERMDSSIYFPLYLVLVTPDQRNSAVYYLSADLQTSELFSPRKPLGENARRAGWCGFLYELHTVRERMVRLI